MKNEEQPAFRNDSGQDSGLSKLEYAAIHAMGGLLANSYIAQGITTYEWHKDLCMTAIRNAKELLNQLENQTEI
jgi:hypothetical protein